MQPIWQTGLSNSREQLVEPRGWVTVDPTQHVGVQAALLLIAPAPAGFFGANDLDPLSLTFDAVRCPLRGQTRPSAGEVANDGAGVESSGLIVAG
jgi:hypothetical protein